MNWTKEPPKKAGYYLWRENESWTPIAITVVKDAFENLVCADGINGGPMALMEKGQWLPLIPGDVFAKEIEMAHREAIERTTGYKPNEIKAFYAQSRAKKVAEGEIV